MLRQNIAPHGNPANLTLELSRRASVMPDAPALLSDRRFLTYAQLDALTWGAARYLLDGGIAPSQIVALACDAPRDLLVAMLGLTRLGACIVSIPGEAPPARARELAAQAGASVLVGNRRRAGEAGLPALEFPASFDASASAAPGLLRERPEAPWLLIQGSGSTGSAKIIPLTHGTTRSRLDLTGRIRSLNPGERVFVSVGLDYLFAKYRFWVAIFSGACFALPEHAGSVAADMAALRPAVADLTVLHAEQLVGARQAQDPAGGAQVGGGNLREIAVYGSTVGEDLRRRLRERTGARLAVVYVTNETGPIAIAWPDAREGLPDTVGHPVPGVEVGIVDPSGQPLPVGQTGILRVRSPGLVDGYLHDADATGRSFRDGWFHTGDLASLAPDGQVIHRGRADGMMILNGLNIHPAEIERAMLSHPAVRDVAALPLRHPVHQDIPICAVALHPGSLVGEEALKRHAAAQLGGSGPGLVFILEALPRNRQGKLARADLVRTVQARLDERLRRASSSAPNPA